jgi:hypothetical protein
MGKEDVQSERLRKALVRGEFLAVVQRQGIPHPPGIGLKARTAALFKADAALSGIIFAGSSFVFRPANAAIQAFLPALSTVSPSQSPDRDFSSTIF